jgi:YD repeat-containing protein
VPEVGEVHRYDREDRLISVTIAPGKRTHDDG